MSLCPAMRRTRRAPTWNAPNRKKELYKEHGSKNRQTILIKKNRFLIRCNGLLPNLCERTGRKRKPHINICIRKDTHKNTARRKKTRRIRSHNVWPNMHSSFFLPHDKIMILFLFFLLSLVGFVADSKTYKQILYQTISHFCFTLCLFRRLINDQQIEHRGRRHSSNSCKIRSRRVQHVPFTKN